MIMKRAPITNDNDVVTDSLSKVNNNLCAMLFEGPDSLSLGQGLLRGATFAAARVANLSTVTHAKSGSPTGTSAGREASSNPTPRHRVTSRVTQWR